MEAFSNNPPAGTFPSFGSVFPFPVRSYCRRVRFIYTAHEKPRLRLSVPLCAPSASAVVAVPSAASWAALRGSDGLRVALPVLACPTVAPPVRSAQRPRRRSPALSPILSPLRLRLSPWVALPLSLGVCLACLLCAPCGAFCGYVAAVCAWGGVEGFGLFSVGAVAVSVSVSMNE